MRVQSARKTIQDGGNTRKLKGNAINTKPFTTISTNPVTKPVSRLGSALGTATRNSGSLLRAR